MSELMETIDFESQINKIVNNSNLDYDIVVSVFSIIYKKVIEEKIPLFDALLIFEEELSIINDNMKETAARVC